MIIGPVNKGLDTPYQNQGFNRLSQRFHIAKHISWQTCLGPGPGQFSSPRTSRSVLQMHSSIQCFLSCVNQWEPLV